MSDIQFEENLSPTNSYKSRSILGDYATPGMVKTVMHLFRFKSEKGAGNFLIAIAIICALLGAFFAFKLFYKPQGEAIINPNLPENIRSVLPINE